MRKLATFQGIAQISCKVSLATNTSLVTEIIDEELLDKKSRDEEENGNPEKKSQADSNLMVKNASAPVFYPTEPPIETLYMPKQEKVELTTKRKAKLFFPKRKEISNISLPKPKPSTQNLKSRFARERSSLNTYLKKSSLTSRPKLKPRRKSKSNKRTVIIIKKKHMTNLKKK